ncbi:MAG: LysR family transcriptional regulator [Sphingobium sp.]
MVDLDLNLLRVFDALHELRSVTRAAGRLGLTQSAISHALGRLRTALDDPLFHRSAGGLQPTARALEIAPGIREGLGQIRGALAPSLFDPAKAERQFAIGAASYFCTILIPDLLARARTVAPGINFLVVNPLPDMLAALDEGTVDLVVGAFGKVPARFLCEPLYREELVWIASRNHPMIDDPFFARRIVEQPRLEIIAGRPTSGGGAYASAGGLEWRVTTDSGRSSDRRIGVYDAGAAVRLVSQTDLVARVPRQLAMRAADPVNLAIIEGAPRTEQVGMSMVSHLRLASDAGLSWLRALIFDTLPLVLKDVDAD